MSLSEVQFVIEEAIESGRLSGSVFSRESVDEHSIVYRIGDDIILDEFGQILREHIVVGTVSDYPGWRESFKKLLAELVYRCGVGSIVIVGGGGFLESFESVARELRIHLFEFENDITLPFYLPMNQENLNQIIPESDEIETDNYLGFEAFEFLVKVYMDEEPIIDKDLTYEDRKFYTDYARSIGGYEGEYDLDRRLSNDHYIFYYRYWRLGIEQKRYRAFRLYRQLQSVEGTDSAWPTRILTQTLRLTTEYFYELLYGVNTLETAKSLLGCFDELRRRESLTPLLERLRSGSLLDIRKLLKMLGGFRASGAIDALSETLGSPEKEIRRWTINAMSRLNDPSTVGYLERALQDRNNRVRSAAIDGLTELGGDLAARVLSDYYNNCPSKERGAVLSALAETRSILAYHVLLEALLSYDKGTAASAGWPIKELISDPRNAEAVRRKWHDTEEQKRKQVVDCLAKKIEEKENFETAIKLLALLREPSAVPSIVAALSFEEFGLEYEAAKALGEIGGADAAKGLTEAVRRRGGEVNWAVIEAIGKLGIREAVPLLLELLRKEKHTPRVIEALGLIGDRETVPEIERAVERNKNLAPEAAKALVQLGALDASRQIQETLPSKRTSSIRDASIHYRYPDGRRSSTIKMQ